VNVSQLQLLLNQFSCLKSQKLVNGEKMKKKTIELFPELCYNVYKQKRLGPVE